MKIIITGATGMAGEGVLLECLANPQVEEILLLSRRPSGRIEPKIRELLLPNFFAVETVRAQLRGYDACFFCAGVSSVGMKPEDYRRQTHDLTLAVARVLHEENPELVFCYITGAGTDASKGGWARTKGETENALIKLFRHAYMFRPGFMLAMPGQRHVLKYYLYLAWIYPVGRKLTPAWFCTLQEVARAMIRVASTKPEQSIVEVADIVRLAAAQ